MSPIATAPAWAPPAPPPRPGFLAVAWATLLGYFYTLLLALPLVFAASYAGLDPMDRWDSVGRGVFYRYDGWSWAAEACLGLLAVGITAAIVGNRLRSYTGWEVPYGTICLILLGTGYAPVLALTPLYGATGLVSLALAAILLRWRARPSGAEPLTPLGQVPRRYRRAVAIAVAVGGPLMAAYVLGYAATHPLRFDSGFSMGKRVFEWQPGKVVRYTFRLQNAGSAAVTDLEVVKTEGSPALQLERALAPAELGGDDQDHFLTLQLRQGPTCPARPAALESLWVRYDVLGTRQEQRVPLVNGPSVRCP
jgi:hypothetical protein